MELDLSSGIAPGNGRIAEVESAMAAEARKRLAKEQDLATFGGIRHSTVVAAIVVTVIRRSGRDDAPLEAGQCLRDVLHAETVDVVGERAFEKNLVLLIGAQHRQKAVALPQAQFDRVIAEH